MQLHFRFAILLTQRHLKAINTSILSLLPRGERLERPGQAFKAIAPGTGEETIDRMSELVLIGVDIDYCGHIQPGKRRSVGLGEWCQRTTWNPAQLTVLHTRLLLFFRSRALGLQLLQPLHIRYGRAPEPLRHR
mgnify:CR=1 FL=1